MEFGFIGTHTTTAWDEWNHYGVEADEDKGRLVLTTDLTPAYVSPDTVIENPPTGFEPIDIDVDDCGILYVLTSEGDLYEYDPERAILRRLPCIGEKGDTEALPGNPTALCVTDDTIYIAYSAASSESGSGASGGGRVRAISRYLLQTRWVARMAGEVSFESPGRIIEASGTIHVLDEAGFLAVLGSDGRAEQVVTELKTPRDFGVDGDGNLYILDAQSDDPGDSVVQTFDAEYAPVTGGDIPASEFEAIGTRKDVKGTGKDIEAACIAVSSKGMILMGVAPKTPGETVLFRYVPDQEGFERMPSFKRSCQRLRLRANRTNRSGDQRQGLYAIDGKEHRIYFLRKTIQNNRTPGGNVPYDGRVAKRLDSDVRGMQWHRVTAELGLGGSGTRIRLRYYATDDGDEEMDDLEEIPGIGETFASRLRRANVMNSSELVALTAQEIATVCGTDVNRAKRWLDEARDRLANHGDISARWTELTTPNPQDALLDDATGQFLWVELELVGTEDSSPWVESFRAYFPRQSYLRYLPAIYREDERSAAFLERFLSIFESAFVEVEEEIGSITKYLDAYGIPGEYLSWLASWLAVKIDETWDETAKRRFIAEAPGLFKKRGTRAGLLAVLRIYLGEDVNENSKTEDNETPVAEHDDRHPFFLVEYADLDCIDTEAVRTVYRRFVRCPQCFLVLVRPGIDDERMQTVKRLVESETPAHAVGRAVELQARTELGGNTYLGINSTLAEREFVLERAGLGKDSVLVEREEYGHLGLKATLGSDTVMS